MKGSFRMTRWMAVFVLSCVVAAAAADQVTFPSPASAVRALASAVRSNDQARLQAILGPDAGPLIHTGDAVADKRGRSRFLTAYDTSHGLVARTDGSVVLDVGTESWPFPIPLVREGSAWRFDTQAGVQDILDRRIGADELNAVQVCEAYVAAQRDYASQIREDGLVQYAQHYMSTAGHHDGLYWAVVPGQARSPMGAMVAQASAEGYAVGQGKHEPYHGYHFHILKRQGESAPGGSYDYVINGHMVAGFGLV
ncbi:MAG TPA: DUF2950 family protein, partial [Candidatus Xenobia bacterium]